MHSQELCTVGIIGIQRGQLFSCYSFEPWCERFNGKFPVCLLSFFHCWETVINFVQIIPPTRVATHHYGDCIERLCIPNGDDGMCTGIRVQCRQGPNHVRGLDIWGQQVGCKWDRFIYQGSKSLNYLSCRLTILFSSLFCALHSPAQWHFQQYAKVNSLPMPLFPINCWCTSYFRIQELVFTLYHGLCKSHSFCIDPYPVYCKCM